MEKTVTVGYSGEGLDIGSDNVSAVSLDYTSPFRFGGAIYGVTVALKQ